MIMYRKGKDHGMWKGGFTYDIYGYKFLLMREHPRAHNGYVREHRLVMEEYLGRYLESKEHIHHINGVKDDNRLENLLMISPNKHPVIHQQDIRKRKDIGSRICFDCGSDKTVITHYKNHWSAIERWFKLKDIDRWICSKCYKRRFRYKHHEAVKDKT